MKYSNGLPDYYDLLKIPPDADVPTIKKGFRQRAKEIHPDIRRSDDASASNMTELLAAYETLIDDRLREEYDIQYRAAYPSGGFDYRDFLANRPGDPDAAGKLIFFDLLHAHEREALDLYDTLVREKSFDLSMHLDREDFMDCSFLLAEEYIEKGIYASAFKIFKTLMEYEFERPYFRHFFQELVDRCRNLLVHQMDNNVTLEQHIDFVLQIARMPLKEGERAVYMKKLAELYIRKGESSRASYFVHEAKKLNPRIGGMQQIEKLLQKNPFKV